MSDPAEQVVANLQPPRPKASPAKRITLAILAVSGLMVLPVLVFGGAQALGYNLTTFSVQIQAFVLDNARAAGLILAGYVIKGLLGLSTVEYSIPTAPGGKPDAKVAFIVPGSIKKYGETVQFRSKRMTWEVSSALWLKRRVGGYQISEPVKVSVADGMVTLQTKALEGTVQAANADELRMNRELYRKGLYEDP